MRLLEGVSSWFLVRNLSRACPLGQTRPRGWGSSKYLDGLGLKREGVSCHSSRHSAATWARFGGAKLDALAGMLGHASVTKSQLYAHLVDRMTESPAQYLEAVMGG
jgi:integrase